MVAEMPNTPQFLGLKLNHIGKNKLCHIRLGYYVDAPTGHVSKALGGNHAICCCVPE